jgi:hypothetical protein
VKQAASVNRQIGLWMFGAARMEIKAGGLIQGEGRIK